jgi:hypothetical protein
METVRRSASSDTVSASLRLVRFSSGSSTWTIDGLAHEHGAFGASGVPVSVEVEKPETAWIASLTEDLFERWVDEDRVVGVHVKGAARRIRVRFEVDGTRLYAPLVRTLGP